MQSTATQRAGPKPRASAWNLDGTKAPAELSTKLQWCYHPTEDGNSFYHPTPRCPGYTADPDVPWAPPYSMLNPLPEAKGNNNETTGSWWDQVALLVESKQSQLDGPGTPGGGESKLHP